MTLMLERAAIAARVARAMITKKRVPLVGGWNLTYRCNLRCSYCSAWRDKTPEMTTREALATIAQLSDLGCRFVGFAGGETLMREDAGTIVDACADAGMKVSIQSNGVLFPEKVDSLGRVSEMQFSLDGPPEVNDPIRGEGVHDAVVRAETRLLPASPHSLLPALPNRLTIQTESGGGDKPRSL